MRNLESISFFILALILVSLNLAFVDGPSFLRTKAAATVPSSQEGWIYDEYQQVLENVDDAGLVNYRRLKSNRGALDRVAQQLARLPAASYNSWNENKKISFWVNAYNSLTLLAIINNYPIEASFLGSLRFPNNSIRQISGVWDRLAFQIMGEAMTLDQIEHEILRKKFDDPRIHVALVCAAMGCPPLRNEPYEDVRLDEQLDDQAKRFLENPRKFRIDRQTNTVFLSRILDWYGEDFISRFQNSGDFKEHSLQERAVLGFASGYLSLEDAEYLKKGLYSIQYFVYDWSLNEQEPE